MPSLKDGWNINETVLPNLYGADPIPTDQNQLRKELCDFDIAQFGLPSISDKSEKSKGILKGPIVLQLSRYRNVSFPKIGEANHADGIVRLFLTDGHGSLSAIVFERVSGISVDTPPGTKLLLTGDIRMEGSFIVLTKNNVINLGGKVDKLIEKWNIERNQMFKDDRTKSNAPKWIPFGKKGASAATSKGANTKGFKANEVIHSATKKEGADENDDSFELQRKEQIEAAAQAVAAKKFAAPQIQAPSKPQISAEELEQLQLKKQRERQAKVDKGHDRRQKGRRGRRGSDDEEEVPAEFARPSAPSLLFDFLADTVPEASKVPLPPVTNNRFNEEKGRGGRDSGQRSDRGNRFDKGPREERGPRDVTGYKNRDHQPQGRSAFGSEQEKHRGKNINQNPRKEFIDRNQQDPHNKQGNNRDHKNGRDDVRRQDNARDRQGNQKEFRQQRPDGAPQHGNFDNRSQKPPRNHQVQTERTDRGNNSGPVNQNSSRSARDIPRNRTDIVEITRQVSGLRVDTPEFVPRFRIDGPNRIEKKHTSERPTYNEREVREDQTSRNERIQRNFRQEKSGNRDQQAPRGNRTELPSIMRRSERQWKIGDSCLAPWEDGNIYVATVVFVGPGEMCTVKYNDYGNITTLPQGILIIPE